ncbi:hypothetical protein GOP47_0025452 [Adiantum capillus-veneris]|uniref:Gelsolin-like domain-containing protein n=1 Tax=Adiantum capillus-veneris TaxID=13818 RepID=A0A9D4U1B9_ADICA|nr:hypothetical protein GOP47_0025452 [Adiantum capillus-veneris]
MAVSMKDLDPAFQNIGNKQGTDIWRIDQSRSVAIPKSEHKKISSRHCYIILQTRALKSGVLHHEIFYWLGKHASKDDVVGAAIKAIDLDAALGGRAVVYREAEGLETDKFLSYFKPCFMPLDERHPHVNKGDEGHNQIRLFKCNGRHVAHVKEVPFTRASLSHEDVFILDTESKIFQFNGANTDIYHRAKALDVVQYLKENFHKKDCSVAVIEDGKFVADADSGEFWGLFGGFAPLGRKSDRDLGSKSKSTQASLLCLLEGQTLKVQESNIRRELLSTNKCYMLDCGTELFTWVGRDTSLEERRATALATEKLIGLHENSAEIHVTCTIEGFEPHEFKVKFESWPINTPVPISENGRGKVAVLLKHKGFNVKGLLKAAPAKESSSIINSTGKLQVWCVNGSAKFSVPASNHGKFFNSNCYIVLHTFPGERRDDYIVYSWAGHETTLETRSATAEFVTELTSSLKGAVEVLVFEGKEPSHFTSLFSRMFIMKGENVDTGVRLFQVQQSGPHNWQAVEVERDATSLNSSGCLFLQLETSLMMWFGKFSTIEEQEATEILAHYLQPDALSTATLKEGAESELFWEELGGRKIHSSHREPKESARDPHLFSCSMENGQLQVAEVFNFMQNDLLSDEVMILDVHSDIYVWVGQFVNAKLKSKEIGQKYVEQGARYDGLLLETPLYKIVEGYEPPFFKHFFQWDDSKATKHLNAFQKRVAALKGQPVDSSRAQPVDARRSMRRHSISGFESPSEILSTIDRSRIARGSALKAESSPERSYTPKTKYGNGRSPGSRSPAVSALSSMFEFQATREVIPTPKLSSVRTRHESLSTTPTPSISSSPRTPRPVASPRSPAIAALASVFEPYSDKKLDFAWPGLKNRSDEKASRDFEARIPRSTKEVKAVEELPSQAAEVHVEVNSGDGRLICRIKISRTPFAWIKTHFTNFPSGSKTSTRYWWIYSEVMEAIFLKILYTGVSIVDQS